MTVVRELEENEIPKLDEFEFTDENYLYRTQEIIEDGVLIDIKEKKVEELESKIAFYNDLENKIYCLSEENKRLSKNVTKLEEENHTQRQRINDFNKHPIKEIFKAIKRVTENMTSRNEQY